jgi:large subunit ribosomal protein L30e
MIDIGRALKIADSTGEVAFGEREAEKAVKSGQAQLIIVASNYKNDYLASGEHGVKVHRYKGNNMELGALCGKPFSVSALAIIDKGSSNILSVG